MVPYEIEWAPARNLAFAKLRKRQKLFRIGTTFLAKGADRGEFLNLLDDA